MWPAPSTIPPLFLHGSVTLLSHLLLGPLSGAGSGAAKAICGGSGGSSGGGGGGGGGGGNCSSGSGCGDGGGGGGDDGSSGGSGSGGGHSSTPTTTTSLTVSLRPVIITATITTSPIVVVRPFNDQVNGLGHQEADVTHAVYPSVIHGLVQRCWLLCCVLLLLGVVIVVIIVVVVVVVVTVVVVMVVAVVVVVQVLRAEETRGELWPGIGGGQAGGARVWRGVWCGSPAHPVHYFVDELLLRGTESCLCGQVEGLLLWRRGVGLSSRGGVAVGVRGVQGGDGFWGSR